MTKVWLLIYKSETVFQNYVLVIRHWEINPDQDAHQTSIKILLEIKWNAMHTKPLEN